MSSALFTAIVENISTRADKTLKVIIGTDELAPDAKIRLFETHQKLVTVLISPNKISQEEREAVESTASDMLDKKKKSPSQRLRSVLFLTHQKTQSKASFESFYETELERIINHYKAKLNP